MRITLLLAGCTPKYLEDSLSTVVKVLKELDVEVYKVNLECLPYYTGNKSKEMDSVVEAIKASKGVIAFTYVPMLSMHGAMQTFFDQLTLYEGAVLGKPMMVVSYSEWMGEVEAASLMLKSWNVLGGIEGNKLCLNHQVPLKSVEGRVEREAEDFYRLIKQGREVIESSERLIYKFIKTGNALNTLKNKIVSSVPNDKEYKDTVQIRSYVDLLKEEQMETIVSKSEVQSTSRVIERTHETINEEIPKEQPHINLSTKEQTLKEISNLLKKEINEEDTNFGVYKRPGQAETVKSKRLTQLPHYFIAQHDGTLLLNIKYNITDLKEEGYIVIKNGDCSYKEEVEESPTLEIILTEEVFTNIQYKRMTYQKAFMLGKLKVKGNFSILPKLDQIFKAI